ELEDQGSPHHQEAQNDDDEHRRAIATVDEGIAEAALLACLSHFERQRPFKKTPLAAARAPPEKASTHSGTDGMFVSHMPDVRRPKRPRNAGIRHSARALKRNGRGSHIDYPAYPASALMLSVRSRCSGAPDVDAGEEEEPHDVNEMPIPRRGLEAKVLFWRRSEERRVGKECRSRWSPDHEK